MFGLYLSLTDLPCRVRAVGLTDLSCRVRAVGLTDLSCRRQLDSADEQAAAIRRELDGRLQKVAEMERVGPTPNAAHHR